MTRAVLFDLDDTLFDHRGSARAALAAIHGAYAPSFDFRKFEAHHARYLEEMHLEVLAGRLALDDARRERFRRVFAALGADLPPSDVDRVASAYRDAYTASRQVMPGAGALLAAIRPSARIGIVTNNLLEEQQDKLRVCGLSPYVDALIASEDVGVSKPDPGIFALALDRLRVAAADAVMVGDSWRNDIEGALGAGVRAIWFNPDGVPFPRDNAGVPVLQTFDPPARIAQTILGAGR